MKLLLVNLALLLAISVQCQSRRQLTVDLYPYIPDPQAYYNRIKKDFELTHKDIQLTIKLLDNYDDRHGGILDDMADVYEIDCVLLDDFIGKKKIQPLKTNLRIDAMPASGVVFHDNVLYAVPHWLSSNFLFIQKGDRRLEQATNFEELEYVIGHNPASNKSLLTDMAGRRSLGELYFVSLCNQYRDSREIFAHSDTNHIDSQALSEMRRLCSITYPTWTRNEAFHNLSGYYPRQFARKKCRAFVGHSESLYDILSEMKDSCLQKGNCLQPDDLEIKPWAMGRRSYNIPQEQSGWVYALAVDARCSDQRLKDAMEFIVFLSGNQAYYDALLPNNGEVPRYLLPAYRSYYTDNKIIGQAPLYSKLLPLAETIGSLVSPSLGYNLRDVGTKINSLLPF